jgi:putative isomerase
VVNISEPALSQSFLRGHFNAQKSDGFIQYGINQSGRNFHEPLATAPLLSGESWQAYLWSGDRQFLAEAYDKCGPFVRWWRSPERTQAGLQHWRDFVESLRDDKDLATWTATKGAEDQAALDLNCYLLNEERTLARMARELGKFREAGQWQAEADARIATMRDTLWHGGDGVYYGKNLRTAEWARVMDISTFFPLWCGLATPDQAKSIARLLHDPDTFGTRYPVATLAAKEMPDKLRGQYHWRGANWIEMSWLAIQGLAENGHDREAARVAKANCEMAFHTLEKTGHFREFYNSLTGEPSDLTDYIWSSMPAIMIVETLFGIRPAKPGLQIHPRLPAEWDDIRIDNLHVRAARISLHVKRNASRGTSRVIVNGAPRFVEDDGSLLLPWAELPARCDIEILQGPEQSDAESRPVP